MLVNDFSWTELSTNDSDAATKFYGTLFDWRFESKEWAEGTYTEITPDSDPRAGIMTPAGGDVPPSWMPYVTVADLDATIARAIELGGECVVPKTETPLGCKFAVLVDPQGARIGVHQSAEVPAAS
jgi:uncharacterized protein